MKRVLQSLEVEASMMRLVACAFSAVVFPVGLFYCVKTIYLLVVDGSSDVKTLLFISAVSLIAVAATGLWLLVLRRLPKEIRAFRESKRDPLRKLGS